MVTTSDDFKLCQDCLEPKPIDQFRRRSPNGTSRMGECRECHNAAEQTRRANKRLNRQNQMVAGFVTQLKNAKTDKQIRLVCALMFQQFGDVEALTQRWIDQLQAAQKKNAGAKRILDSYAAISKLCQFCDSQRPTEDLSDADVEREVQQSTKRLIQKHPEIAVECARQLGWEVVPTCSASSV